MYWISLICHGSDVLKNSIWYISLTSLPQVHIDYYSFKEKYFIKKKTEGGFEYFN